MHARDLLVATSLLGMAGATVLACGDDDAVNPVPSDGGTDAAQATSDASSSARVTGRIVQAQSTTPLGDATVTIDGQVTKTAADGTYALTFGRNKPVNMNVTAADHFALVEQEFSIGQAEFARGDTQLLSKTLASLLAGLLPNRDPAKGLVAVRVIALPGCTSEEGATLSLDPPAGSKVSYAASGLPDDTRTSVKKGESLSAIFYNVDVGTKVTVKVSSPTCQATAYPVDYQGVTFTGAPVVAAGGESLSFYRAFLGDKIADAGKD